VDDMIYPSSDDYDLPGPKLSQPKEMTASEFEAFECWLHDNDMYEKAMEWAALVAPTSLSDPACGGKSV